MNKKGEAVPESKDNEWLQDLAFIMDITKYLSTKMQGQNKTVTEFYASIRAFGENNFRKIISR